MGFVSFLKKIGLGIIKYAPPLLGIGQIVAETNPKAAPVVSELSAIFAAGQAIEQDFAVAFSGQQTGAQKLLALTLQTQNILQQLDLIKIHGIADEVMFAKGANEIAQGVVDVQQSLKGKDGSTVSGTATAG